MSEEELTPEEVVTPVEETISEVTPEVTVEEIQSDESATEELSEEKAPEAAIREEAVAKENPVVTESVDPAVA